MKVFGGAKSGFLWDRLLRYKYRNTDKFAVQLFLCSKYTRACFLCSLKKQQSCIAIPGGCTGIKVWPQIVTAEALGAHPPPPAWRNHFPPQEFPLCRFILPLHRDTQRQCGARRDPRKAWQSRATGRRGRGGGGRRGEGGGGGIVPGRDAQRAVAPSRGQRCPR